MRRAVLLLTMALVTVACSGDDDDAGSTDATSTTAAPATTDGGVDASADGATEPEEPVAAEPLADEFDLAIVLPAPPDDLDVSEPVYVPGEPLDPTRLDTTQRWLWCDESQGAPVARLAVGDVWLAGEGVGVSVQVNVLTLTAGTEVELPSDFDDLSFFFVDTTQDDPLVPREYGSNEEESSGTLTLDALPCRGEGDVLAVSIDGAIGAETNPGYIAAATVNGRVQMTVTGPPAG